MQTAQLMSVEEMVTVNKRGQFTIPARLRKEFHIRDGTKLLITQDSSSMTIRPVPEIDDLLGVHSGKVTVEDVMDDLVKMRKQDRY